MTTRLWRVRLQARLSRFVNEVEILGATSIREGASPPGTEDRAGVRCGDKGSQENPAWRLTMGDVWEVDR